MNCGRPPAFSRKYTGPPSAGREPEGTQTPVNAYAFSSGLNIKYIYGYFARRIFCFSQDFSKQGFPGVCNSAKGSDSRKVPER
jgi:hypothetical protein